MRRSSAIVAVWLTAGAVHAATPSIETVSPGIGQRGTTFELTIVGAGLADAEELFLYQPGVVCESLKAASENELTIRLRAEQKCRTGSHPFRIRTRLGITELRTFRVTPLPVVASVEPNDTRSAAQPIVPGVTVHGVIESDDSDFYRISLKKGERLAAEVEGVRLGGPLLDLKLTAYGPDRALLATVDDTPLLRQDPFLTLIADRDGEYVVCVSENSLEGDADSRYALHIGKFPRPSAIFPLGGPAGQTVEIRALGDAAGEFVQRVRLPVNADSAFEFFPEQNGIAAPTPHRFRVSKFPNILERVPNGTEPAGPASLPAGFNGVIQETGDVDRFKFRAAEGERWRFELFAARLGSSLDGVLSILDASDELLVRSDDDESHDGSLLFDVPETGTYQLQVRDKRGNGGPGFVYRAEAVQVSPSLTAFLPRPDRLSQERQTISVPRRNRVLVHLGVQRDGVDGDVSISATELPSGIAMNGGRVQRDCYWTPVVFEATNDAPLSGTLASVSATAEVDGRAIRGPFRQVVDLVAGPADALYHSSEVDRLAIAVTESAPFRISLDPPTTPLARDGTLELRVRVEREPGFEAPIDVTFPFLPPWVDGPAKITIAPEQTTGTYAVRAWAQAKPQTWIICAEGRPGLDTNPTSMEQTDPQPRPRRRSRKNAGAIRDVRVCSKLVELAIGESPIAAAAVTAAAEQGQTALMRLRLQPAGRLPERFTATIEGLPNRVAAAPVLVNAPFREIEFAIQLEPTAPLGRFPGLVCRLSGEWEGQAVSYCVARDSVLAVEPVGGLKTDGNGRPLTKLQALRRARSKSIPGTPAAESTSSSTSNSSSNPNQPAP